METRGPCRRCNGQRQVERLPLCMECVVAFQPTLIEMERFAGNGPGAGRYALPPVGCFYSLIRGAYFDPDWQDFECELLGWRVHPAPEATQLPVPWITTFDDGTLIEPWQRRVYLGRGPLYLELLWRPGEGERPATIGGLGEQTTADDINRIWRGRRLFGLAPRHLRGRKPGKQIMMDPADWQVAMAYIKSCIDEGCTWPMVLARLDWRERDDPGFPVVPTRDPDRLKTWLDQYTDELSRY